MLSCANNLLCVVDMSLPSEAYFIKPPFPHLHINIFKISAAVENNNNIRDSNTLAENGKIP